MSPAKVSITATDLSLTQFSNTVRLSAPCSGTASGTLYVVVEDPDQSLVLPVVSVEAGSATLSMDVAPDLAPGRYHQAVTVHVCEDAACMREVKGSPQIVAKDITVTSVALGASALAFNTSGGIAPAAKAFSVAVPGSAGFTVGNFDNVTYFEPDGTQSSTAFTLDQVFTVTKTADGVSVQPQGVWPGRYVATLTVSNEGLLDRPVSLEYQVGAVTGEALALQTTSASASGTMIDRDVEILIDATLNMPSSELALGVQLSGTPDPQATQWLRFFNTELGLGADGRTAHLRLYANACFSTCLAPGTYTAQATVTAEGFGKNFSYTVPVTFTVTP